jgi:hypothetical protein
MTSMNSKSRVDKDVLDAATTRARLELIWGRSFDPEALGTHRLHPAETARFIADQMRKLRLAALRSGHTALLWMIESAYYEAYTQGCSKSGLEPEPARRRA